jgi:hypothetical protein
MAKSIFLLSAFRQCQVLVGNYETKEQQKATMEN